MSGYTIPLQYMRKKLLTMHCDKFVLAEHETF